MQLASRVAVPGMGLPGSWLIAEVGVGRGGRSAGRLLRCQALDCGNDGAAEGWLVFCGVWIQGESPPRSR